MQNIPIQAIPNQTLSVALDGNQWGITLKSAAGIIAVSLVLNGAPVITGLRAVAGKRIIPCKYQEAGNFAFLCQQQNLPDYTQFGTTQVLVYLSASELAALRPPTPNIITQDFFDPLGGLPLRFKPQGYTLAS